jgi:hypothetical protein
MNIFQVLSQGKSRLNEPSMSAMLAYLLDSNKDHGLGEAFIRAFLSAVDKNVFGKFLAADFIKSQTELEVPYFLDGSRKDIDIEILLSADDSDDFKVIIENKIKIGAANPKQLSDYYNAILQDDRDIKNLYIVFLTPEHSSHALKAEFENLKLSNIHYKKWLYWDSSSQQSVINMVRDILNFETLGEINPINEYMRHTLKAFIKHASTITKAKSAKSIRIGEDIGEIIEEEEISLQNGEKYIVIRRDSSQVQVYNVQTGEKQVARQILSKFIDEHNLDIPHKQLNTRAIGRKFFEYLSLKKRKDK